MGVAVFFFWISFVIVSFATPYMFVSFCLVVSFNDFVLKEIMRDYLFSSCKLLLHVKLESLAYGFIYSISFNLPSIYSMCNIKCALNFYLCHRSKDNSCDAQTARYIK